MTEPNKYYADRLLALLSELVKFSEIERQIYYPDGAKKDRRENDVEHSFNLAISAWYLSRYFPELDASKLIRFALAHDFVEIHAGDVMAIGRTDKEQTQKELKEKEAIETLKNDWPDFPALTNTIDEYEEKATQEAKFIYALDKIMPMMINLLSHGKTWKKLDIDRDDVIENKDEKTKTSPAIHDIWQILKAEMLLHDDYFNEKDNK